MAIDISALLQTQYSLYQYNSDNALLRVKLAQAERWQKESDAIRDKYDGSVEAEYEARFKAAVDAKAAIVAPYQRVQTALGKIDDIRNKLLELRAAAAMGAAEAFDYAHSTLTTMVGSSWLDSQSLMSNNRTQSMTWPDRPELFSAGNYQVQLNHYFLGNDYAIELDDGSGVVRPDPSTGTLTGGSVTGTAYADLTNVTINGDQITFDAGGTTHTGTLKTGGGGVLNAWAYSNFTSSNPDPDQNAAEVAALKASAMAAIDDAIERVRMAETQWGIAEAQLSGALNTLGLRQDQAKEAFELKSNEVLDAKNAELRAAKTRYELSVNTLSLTSGQASNFIQQMFMTSPFGEKKSLFEIIGGT